MLKSRVQGEGLVLKEGTMCGHRGTSVFGGSDMRGDLLMSSVFSGK